MEWFLFSLAGLFWGTSFYWIKIALREIDSLSLITWRVSIATLGLLFVVLLKRKKITRNWRIWMRLLAVSFFSPFLGFFLITWGETRVDSSVASILNGTMPLFAIIFAHFAVHDERMSWNKTLGLVLGFIGVILLFSRNIGSTAFAGNLVGQLSVLGGAASYAVSGVLSRRVLRNYPPLEQSLGVVSGSIFWGAIMFLLQGRIIQVPVEPMTWLALTWLGLLGTSAAWIMYFELFNRWGVVKASAVNYILPVVGILAGVLFLNEPLHWQLIMGAIAIFGGIAVLHSKPRQKKERY